MLTPLLMGTTENFSRFYSRQAAALNWKIVSMFFWFVAHVSLGSQRESKTTAQRRKCETKLFHIEDSQCCAGPQVHHKIERESGKISRTFAATVSATIVRNEQKSNTERARDWGARRPNIYTHKNKQSGKITGLDVTILRYFFSLSRALSFSEFDVRLGKFVMSNGAADSDGGGKKALSSASSNQSNEAEDTHEVGCVCVTSKYPQFFFWRKTNCSAQKYRKLQTDFWFVRQFARNDHPRKSGGEKTATVVAILLHDCAHINSLDDQNVVAVLYFRLIFHSLRALDSNSMELLKWLQWFEYMNDCRVQITALSNTRNNKTVLCLRFGSNESENKNNLYHLRLRSRSPFDVFQCMENWISIWI